MYCICQCRAWVCCWHPWCDGVSANRWPSLLTDNNEFQPCFPWCTSTKIIALPTPCHRGSWETLPLEPLLNPAIEAAAKPCHWSCCKTLPLVLLQNPEPCPPLTLGFFEFLWRGNTTRLLL